MTKTLCLPKKQTLLLMAIFAVHSVFAQTIRYVNAGLASGLNNGTSWANAYKDLQPALAAAQTGDQIWVAKGTYYPTTSTTDRTASFIMKNNLGIYGSFAGNETLLTQRDWKNNVTTLSGDIDHTTDPLVVTGSGVTLSITGNAGNSYNVIKNDNNGLDATAILDGFSVRGGYASASNDGTSRSLGGGMYNASSSPSLANLVFLANSTQTAGGGMYNALSTLSLTNCVFFGNTSYGNGGGVSDVFASPSFVNCVFSGNSATTNAAGIETLTYYQSTRSSFINCIFSGNNALGNGGGMFNASTFSLPPIVINCTFSGNSAASGSVMYNAASSAIVQNSIIWGNADGIYNINGGTTTISNSNVQGGYAGTGNINQDPLFVNAANPAGVDGIFGTTDDGLTLQSTSPCINKGNNAAIPTGVTTDITGSQRIAGGTVDMGAYESNYTHPTAFIGCPNINLAIARPGYNTYNNEPVSIYNVDTATGTATLIPGGPLKDASTGKNININGVGLNSVDGFVYAIRDSANTFYRIGSNYANIKLGKIPSPTSLVPGSSGSNAFAVIPAAAGMDNLDNYYVIGVSGSYQPVGNSTLFTPKAFYVGQLSNVSSLLPDSVYLNLTWIKIDFSGVNCSNFYSNITTPVNSAGMYYSGQSAGTGFQDITYSNLYKSLYIYEVFESPIGSGNFSGELMGINPTTGVATCYPAAPFGATNNEVAGISTTASGNLEVLMTSGDIYKTSMSATDFATTLTKVGSSGITSLGFAGSIRGDLASCNVGPTTLPTSRPSGLVVSLPDAIVGYPNPARGTITLAFNRSLTNATLRLVTLSGNVISETTGVSGNTFKMDLSKGASGIYMVEVTEAGNSSRLKIIKE